MSTIGVKAIKYPDGDSAIDITDGGNVTLAGTLGVTGAITGTLATAAQPNVTSVGTLTGFRSTGIDDNADALAITITSDENVGIGTASPERAFHVYSTEIVQAMIETNGSSARLAFKSSGSNTNAGNLIAVDANDMFFRTNNTERMRINSNGNVGIGVVPETTWHSSRYALQLGLGASIFGDTTATGCQISANTVSTLGSSLNGYKYINSDKASTYQQYDGQHNFRVASSGSADGAITWNTALTINNSGNVGIGTAPSQKLHVAGSGNQFIYLNNTTTGDSFYFKAGSGASSIQTGGGSQVMNFFTSGNERMRIHSNGTVSVGSGNSTGGDQFKIHNTGSGFILNLANDSQSNGCLITAQSGTGTVTHHQINNSNGLVGKIVSSGSGTSYVTSSDYRLKENVTYDFDATSRLKQLKPCRFNFKADANTTVDGFLAHEVTVVPEAISGEKDATNEDGSIKPQGIDQSKLVPLLTKTLQEALARIDTLEAEVKALKG